MGLLRVELYKLGRHVLPRWLGAMAPVWPSYHLNCIAQHVVGLSPDSPWPHALVLLAIATEDDTSRNIKHEVVKGFLISGINIADYLL